MGKDGPIVSKPQTPESNKGLFLMRYFGLRKGGTVVDTKSFGPGLADDQLTVSKG